MTYLSEKYCTRLSTKESDLGSWWQLMTNNTGNTFKSWKYTGLITLGVTWMGGGGGVEGWASMRHLPSCWVVLTSHKRRASHVGSCPPCMKGAWRGAPHPHKKCYKENGLIVYAANFFGQILFEGEGIYSQTKKGLILYTVFFYFYFYLFFIYIFFY